MQDFKGILQGAIVAALVVIAGLLFSISRKLDNQKVDGPAPAVQTAVQTPAATTPAPAPTVAETPTAATATPARKSKPLPSKPEPVVTASDAHPKVDAPIPAAAAAPPPTEPSYSAPPTQAVQAPPPPAPPPVRVLTLPAGTSFTVRLLDRIDSERNRQGDTFQTSLEEPLTVDGIVVAPRGSSVMGRLVQARQSGRVSGTAEVTLELQRMSTIAGDQQIVSDVIQKEAPKTRGSDAAKVGILSGLGAIIGGIAGGGKGAGIGAGAGAGGGVIGVLATRGKPIKLDPETRLTFRLRSPLSVNADGSRTQVQSSDSPYANPNNGPATQTDRADRPYLRRRPYRAYP